MKWYLLFFLPFAAFASVNSTPEEWGHGKFIIENYYDRDNRYVKLNDNSVWQLNYSYNSFTDRLRGKDAQSSWLAPDRVDIKRSSNPKFPYRMVNLDTQESSEARQIDPLIRLGSVLKRIQLQTTVVTPPSQSAQRH